MAARIAGYPGVITYRQRGPIAETPFGNRKHNRNFRRFSMRGLARVTGERTFETHPVIGRFPETKNLGGRPAADRRGLGGDAGDRAGESPRRVRWQSVR